MTTVNPQRFAAAMSHRWVSDEIKNVVNRPLQATWLQMAETFNQHIEGKVHDKWSVLHPPTGTGKTEGLKLYCAMLPEKNHPGVLIVTRLKEEAEGIANSINKIAKRQIAATHHSDMKLGKDEMQSAPVLVITHRAYELALEHVNEYSDASSWEQFCQWRDGQRKLVVIDEALSILKSTSTHYDALIAARGHIPQWVAEQHIQEIDALDKLLERMSSFIEHTPDKERKHIDAGYWNRGVLVDFTPLRSALRKVSLDENVLGRRSEQERTGLTKRLNEALSALEVLSRSWSLYALKGKRHTFSTASVIIPPGKMNAVVLDATAAVNPVYDLLGRKAVLMPPPSGIRNYRNVTVHVSIGHRVGKATLTANAEKECPTFVANMQKEIDADRKVFVCTHKPVKSHMQGYAHHFQAYQVENWGAIDGRNKWQDFDTLVMFGLPYLEPMQPEITLLAFEEWRRKKFSPKERETYQAELSMGYLVVPLIQAINRIRCRRITNEQGDCDITDIYLPLPDREAEGILAAIQDEMSEIDFKKWNVPVAQKKLKRSNYEEPLLSHLKTLKRGEHPAKEVMKALGIAKRTFEALVSKLKKEGPIQAELQKAGISYEVRGIGRKAVSYFVMA